MTWRREDLAYCSNVHAGTDLAAIASNLTGPMASVRTHRGLGEMGCGLWLPATAARTLAEEPEPLRHWLSSGGLYLFTLNGFPYGDFHRDRVKEAVYRPAWDEPERLRYTTDLSRALAACLPEGRNEGTVSSLPLGYAPDWTPQRQARALDNLCRLAALLESLESRTGRRIRVCLEPEPGCVLETTEQAIALFTRDLPAVASRIGVSEAALRNHLGVCFDVCHQAVMFEDTGDSLARLTRAGVPVGKIQVSSALEISDPSSPGRDALLSPFAEPRYLHQVRCRSAEGELRGVPDLEQAIAAGADALPPDRPWRVHFHVPIQAGTLAPGGLGTTRESILPVLDLLRAEPTLRPHLEVETYTWEVLPPGQRPRDAAELARGLAVELAWLEARMSERRLIAESGATTRARQAVPR